MARKPAKRRSSSENLPAVTAPDAAARALSEAPQSSGPASLHNAYNRVVGLAKLRTVRLVSCNFHVKPSIDSTSKKPEFFLDRELTHFDLDAEGTASGLFTWITTVEAEKEKALEARCAFLVQYDGVAGADERAAYAFVERVGTMASYPYFRGMVAQLNWAAEADLPPLPVITSATFDEADGHRAALAQAEAPEAP